MSDDGFTAERIARPYIEQCRRDIAAAWLQLDAARELLKRSYWLFDRWRAHVPPAAVDGPRQAAGR